jgi:hypothetical protein
MAALLVIQASVSIEQYKKYQAAVQPLIETHGDDSRRAAQAWKSWKARTMAVDWLFSN